MEVKLRNRSKLMSRRSQDTGWKGAWLRDSGLMLFSQGALTAIAMLVMVLLARNLSKYQFGVFSSFLGLAQALSFVVDAGLSTWLLRECARIRVGNDSTDDQDANIAEHLSHSLSTVVQMGVITVAGSVVVGLALGLSLELSLTQGAFMSYVALLAAASALEARLRAERQVGQVLSAILVEKGSLLVLVGAALAIGGGLMAIAAVYIVAGGCRVLIDYRRSLKPLGSSGLIVAPRKIFRLLRVTAPFGLNSAALFFLPRLDTAVVATVSVIGASYYALGFQIVTTAQLVPAIASITLIPLLTAHHGAQESRWKIFGAMIGVGAIVATVGILLAPFVVPWLFGDQYRVAVGSIQIMMLAIPPIFACNTLVPFLYTRGHEHDVVRWVLLPSALGTCLVLLGEASLGPNGASLGLVARYLLITISFVLLSFRSSARLVTTEKTAELPVPAARSSL